jgi:hypothetical protein
MRSQIATASKRNLRFLAFFFTEHEAIMATELKVALENRKNRTARLRDGDLGESRASHRLDRGSTTFTAGGMMKAPELMDVCRRIGDLLIKAHNSRALFEELAFYNGGLPDRIQQIYDGRDIPPTEDELARLGSALTFVEDWARGQPRPKWMTP